MKDAISWFEIPVSDIDRAQKFYETIFGVKLIPMDMHAVKMRMFPTDNPMEGIGGALVYMPEMYEISSKAGVLIYLNGNPDVKIVLDKIEKAGGKVIVPKTEISPEHGFMGIFIDTEGNRIGLHSVPASMLK
jgi:predicted enzyme related to lactoylglutathione lyase